MWEIEGVQETIIIFRKYRREKKLQREIKEREKLNNVK